MKDGVRIRPVGTPLSSDAVAVIRPRLATAEVAEALARGMFHEGKQYDFDFDFTRADRLVCTEVIYRSYDGIGKIGFELTSRAGRLTLSAEDLVRMAVVGRDFEPLAVFAPDHTPKLVGGKAAGVLLKKTVALSQ